jgi:hypothetical protein
MESAPGPTTTISPLAACVGRALCALLLTIFSVVLCWTGIKAIREGRYVSISTVERSVTIGVGLNEEATFTDVYEGMSARRMGAGLVSFGLLLAVWALGIVVLGSRQPGPRPGPLAVLGLALTAAGVVLVCPPWRVGESPLLRFFWGSALVWFASVVLVMGRSTKRQLTIFVAVLFVVTLLAEFAMPLRNSGGFVCGFVAALLGLVEVAYVYPPWRQALLAFGPTPPP